MHKGVRETGSRLLFMKQSGIDWSYGVSNIRIELAISGVILCLAGLRLYLSLLKDRSEAQSLAISEIINPKTAKFSPKPVKAETVITLNAPHFDVSPPEFKQ